MMQEYRLVIFDWDGTLMDSVGQIVECMQAAIRDLELPVRNEEQIKNIIGLGLHEAIEQLFPGHPPEFAERVAGRYRHYYLSGEASPSSLFDGVVGMLDSLRDAGYRMAVATGKGRLGLDKVLAETGVGHYFEATRCSDETRSKPHPQMLHELMAELGSGPGETLMVGDTEYDMEMACRAGVGPLAVSYGVHDCRRLHRHAPLACLDYIGELPAWLHQAAGRRRAGG